MTNIGIEKRLSAIENEIVHLKAERAPAKAHLIHSLEKIHGTFEDDDAFREAARLGRKWRDQIEVGWKQSRKCKMIDGPGVFSEIRQMGRSKRLPVKAKR